MADLTKRLSDAKISTERQTNDGIRTKIQEKRDDLTDRGLLDEFDALAWVSTKSLASGVAHVLLVAGPPTCAEQADE